jgi:hypothetical protein
MSFLFKNLCKRRVFRKHYKTHSREIDQRLVENNEPPNQPQGETSTESEIVAEEQEGDLFRSIALDELQLKFNLKYSLLICSSCNVGLKQCEKYLESHFTNKSHSKKRYVKK